MLPHAVSGGNLNGAVTSHSNVQRRIAHENWWEVSTLLIPSF
jgi:hypothetical protein